MFCDTYMYSFKKNLFGLHIVTIDLQFVHLHTILIIFYRLIFCPVAGFKLRPGTPLLSFPSLASFFQIGFLKVGKEN